MSTVHIHLSQFKGPLDLLLHLVGRAKIDIQDIFVSEVTEQYIRIVRESGEMDMDEASSFVTMAATLLEIKSRSMLPVVPDFLEDEDTPEAQLIQQLEEYARFKQISLEMQAFEEEAGKSFFKLPDEFPLPQPEFEISGLTLEGLVRAFINVSRRVREEALDEEPGGHIEAERFSVSACMAMILKYPRKTPLKFSGLLSPRASRDEVVTVFLAMLELMKQGKAWAKQDSNYEDITLYVGRRKENDDE
ncbi:MAG: segregation/condensation protein A [Eubacteriales bacterium]|nr:segregation/condensation protein A [Eubacteriales bacterium]